MSVWCLQRRRGRPFSVKKCKKNCSTSYFNTNLMLNMFCLLFKYSTIQHKVLGCKMVTAFHLHNKLFSASCYLLYSACFLHTCVLTLCWAEQQKWVCMLQRNIHIEDRSAGGPIIKQCVGKRLSVTNGLFDMWTKT